MGLSPTTTRSFGRAGQFTGDSSSPVIHQDDFNQPEGASSPIAERVNRQDDIQEESAQEQQRPAQMQAEP
ncbi:uncharacterized protein L969DRAFT_87373 [Mixia osmundae IAM 14324]|nr:uncharacterized protein L969DRAFT_87373 [Mixia osmundae IAM 14324]KEI39418.1 hypothetical protein L969DRAFT_87373 [Mixia osmundae IAM 14324]